MGPVTARAASTNKNLLGSHRSSQAPGRIPTKSIAGGEAPSPTVGAPTLASVTRGLEPQSTLRSLVLVEDCDLVWPPSGRTCSARTDGRPADCHQCNDLPRLPDLCDTTEAIGIMNAARPVQHASA